MNGFIVVGCLLMAPIGVLTAMVLLTILGEELDRLLDLIGTKFDKVFRNPEAAFGVFLWALLIVACIGGICVVIGLKMLESEERCKTVEAIKQLEAETR